MNVLINNRTYTTTDSIQSDMMYLPNQNYVFDLDYLSVLMVEGERALEFLQGQISCDVREVTSLQIRQGVMCNLKGRILAALDVLRFSEDCFALVLPQDLLLDTQASLAKVAMLSRVKLRQNSQYKLFGLYVQNDNELVSMDIELPTEKLGSSQNGDCFCYQLEPSFYIALVPEKKADAFAQQELLRGSLAWHALRLQRHQIEIYPETRGQFLPHRLDMHWLGYLNFNKGCYKGQEIIARTHYRATLKHQLVSFKIETPITMHSGLLIYNAEGATEVGEIIDYCPIGDNQYIITASLLIDRPHELQIKSAENQFFSFHIHAGFVVDKNLLD